MNKTIDEIFDVFREMIADESQGTKIKVLQMYTAAADVKKQNERENIYIECLSKDCYNADVTLIGDSYSVVSYTLRNGKGNTEQYQVGKDGKLQPYVFKSMEQAFVALICLMGNKLENSDSVELICNMLKFNN